MGLKISVKNQILNKTFRNTDFTQAAAVYASLHTADPGDTGASEATGYSGTRKAVTFNAPATGHIDNSGVLTFASVSPGITVTHLGLWDAASGGNFLGGHALVASKVVSGGDSFVVAAGDLDMTIGD